MPVQRWGNISSKTHQIAWLLLFIRAEYSNFTTHFTLQSNTTVSAVLKPSTVLFQSSAIAKMHLESVYNMHIHVEHTVDQ